MREEIFKGNCFKIVTESGEFFVPEKIVKFKPKMVEDFLELVGDSVFDTDASYELLRNVWMARLVSSDESTEWSVHESYQAAQQCLRNQDDFEEAEYNDKFQQDKYIPWVE